MEDNDSKENSFTVKEQGQLSIHKETNKTFGNFKREYLKNIEHVTNYLDSVYTNETLNLDSIYFTLNEMFSTLDIKIDVILYLNAIYTQAFFIHEHSIRVALLANLFASWLKLSPDEIRDLTVAGLLHDIGMLQVPREIIEKPEKLTNDELVILQGHTAAGSIMLMNKGLSDEVWEVARAHHERYDGSGYPKGRKGNNIGFYAKAISIVDSYDAMTSFRSYSKAQCPFDVIKHFERQMMDKFDPELLYIFLENIPYMYKGSLVELSNKEQAQVVFINHKFKTSPIVKLVSSGAMVDLSMQKNLYIIKLL